MIPAIGGGQADAMLDEPLLGVPRVLIVDEAVPIVRALREILHRLGVAREDVVHASTPAEALAWFKGESPHVVFAELIGTHNEDGLEVVLEMLERAPDAKVILLTAEGRDCPEVRAALRAGIFAHLEKPLRMDKVRAVMQDVAAEEGNIERYK